MQCVVSFTAVLSACHQLHDGSFAVRKQITSIPARRPPIHPSTVPYVRTRANTYTRIRICRFQLRPEEEALVEEVLKRPDADFGMMAANPFEISPALSVPPGPDDLAVLSRPATGMSVASLGGEASVGELLGGASSCSMQLQGEPSGAVSIDRGLAAEGSNSNNPDQRVSASGSAIGPRPSTTGSSVTVDLSLGLAVHTHALLRQKCAEVAGLPLGVINARLEEFAFDHVWGADGSLADFSSVAASLGGWCVCDCVCVCVCACMRAHVCVVGGRVQTARLADLSSIVASLDGCSC